MTPAPSPEKPSAEQDTVCSDCGQPQGHAPDCPILKRERTEDRTAFQVAERSRKQEAPRPGHKGMSEGEPGPPLAPASTEHPERRRWTIWVHKTGAIVEAKLGDLFREVPDWERVTVEEVPSAEVKRSGPEIREERT